MDSKSSLESPSTVEPLQVSKKDEELEFIPAKALKVYPGNFESASTFKSIPINPNTNVQSLLQATLKRFRVLDPKIECYCISISPIDFSTGEALYIGVTLSNYR